MTEVAKKHPCGEKALWYAVLAYAFVFSFVFWLQYKNFRLHSGDLAIYMQSLYSATQGSFFTASFVGGSHFQAHCSPVMFLLLPFYAAVPHALTLYVLLLLSLAVAAMGLYRFLSTRFGPVWAYVGAMLFLFHPTVLGQHLWCLHMAPFVLAPLAWALWFYDQKKLKPFLLCWILSLSAVEYFNFTLVPFPLWAWIQKRNKVWVWVPLGWCVVFFVMAKLTINQPAVGGSVALTRLIENPGLIWGQLEERWTFLVYALLPLGFLPLFTRKVIWLLPTIAIQLFICAAYRWQVYWHTVSLLPLLGIWALGDRAHHFLSWRPYKQKALVSLLALLTLATSCWVYRDLDLGPHPQKEDYQKLLSQLPKDASVTVPRRLSAYVANRKIMYYYDHKQLTDYVVMDASAGWEMKAFDGVHIQTIKAAYTQVFGEAGLFLLKRKP